MLEENFRRLEEKTQRHDGNADKEIKKLREEVQQDLHEMKQQLMNTLVQNQKNQLAEVIDLLKQQQDQQQQQQQGL